MLYILYIIIIVFVVVVVMLQNRQVIVTSLGPFLVQWGLHPPKSQLLEFLQRLEEDGCGKRWRVIAILLSKMCVRRWHVKSGWGTSVDAHEGRYFVW